LTIGEDIEDEDDDDDDIDLDNDDEDVHNDIDGINHNVDESHGPDGDDLNIFVNQLEEWEEAADSEDNSTSGSPSCGDKRPRSSTVPARLWRKPIKVHVTTGAKPKAGDYEVAVQKVLGEAIPLYCGYLSVVTPYPGPMEEMRWAKRSWKDGCEECETRMAPNDKIIKLVKCLCQLPNNMMCSPSPKITSRSSHFRGRIKTKVQPLVKSMYGFSAFDKPRSIDHNIRLARELKDKFSFVYAVCFS
jgi:hypothetical protein